MKNHALFSLLLTIQAAALRAAETDHAAQLKQLTEQRDNAVKAVTKPIDDKYHELLANLQKSAAAAGDFETAAAIQKILSGGKATPNMADYFPAGSTWKGMRINRSGDDVLKIEYRITRSDAASATVQYENEHGYWDAELVLRDGLIELKSLKALAGQGLNLIYDIKVVGRMETLNGKKRVELKGSWKWKSPDSKVKGENPDVVMIMEEK